MVHPSIWKRQDERAFLSPKTDIEKVEQRQSLATLAKLSKCILLSFLFFFVLLRNMLIFR